MESASQSRSLGFPGKVSAVQNDLKRRFLSQNQDFCAIEQPNLRSLGSLLAGLLSGGEAWCEERPLSAAGGGAAIKGVESGKNVILADFGLWSW